MKKIREKPIISIDEYKEQYFHGEDMIDFDYIREYRFYGILIRRTKSVLTSNEESKDKLSVGFKLIHYKLPKHLDIKQICITLAET